MNAPEEVTVTAMLCDAAQVMGDKLYILGGGWSYAWSAPPGTPVTMALAVLIQVPWSATNIRLNIDTRLLDEDGEQVTQEYGEVRAQGTIEAGRPPGARHGAPIPLPFVVSYPPMPLAYGGYVWQVEINGEVRARVPFQVTTPPGFEPPPPDAEESQEGTSE